MTKWLFVNSLTSYLLRKKIMRFSDYEETGPLKRSLTLFDLIMYGMSSMCGGYIYGASIVLIATKSGACSFVSNIITGIIAVLNAQCYVELSSRLSSGGGGYNFTYMICGEFLAFLTGWFMLLEYLLGVAFASIGAANSIDMLSNHTINNAIIHYLGHFPDAHGYLADSPNILAAVITIATLILLSFGAKISVGVNNIIAIFSNVVLIMCTVYMGINTNFGQFTSHRFVNITNPPQWRSDWLPFGIGGVINGAAITFDAFVGFDSLSLTSDIAINAKRNVPLSTNISIILVFFITTLYYISVSFYIPWFEADSKLGLSGVFFVKKIFPMQIIASLGEIAGYVTSTFANMFALSQIVFYQSTDGLFFSIFHYITEKKQIPIYTNLIFGFLAVILALVFDMKIIANFMSAGTIITYTIVAIDLLVLRLVNTAELDHKKTIQFSIEDIAFESCLEKSCNSSKTLSRPFYLIAAITVLIFSAFIASNIFYTNILDNVKTLSIVSVCSCFFLISCAILYCFKYYIPEDSFKVRAVPFIPILTILFNVILVSNLENLAWVRLGVWILIGLFCYAFYGIWNSKLNIKNEESDRLLSNDRLN